MALTKREDIRKLALITASKSGQILEDGKLQSNFGKKYATFTLSMIIKH